MPLATIETDLLILRPLCLDDLDRLIQLHAQESFWRYPFGRGWSRDETKDFLDRTQTHYSDPGIAVCAVVIREANELAGWAGLCVPTFLPEILPAVEVGWRFATEAGGAWIRYGFDDLGLREIVSIYEPDNIDSGAAMRRLGFRLTHTTNHPVYGVPLHVMSLGR